MRFLNLAALPLLSLSFVAACSTEVEDELAGETADDEALDGKADATVDGAYTYFAIRGDTRKCALPYCGGFFLERLNRSATECHDGAAADACYTPELDWSEAGLAEATRYTLTGAAAQGAFASAGVTAIVRGRFAPRGTSKVAPELGRFVVTEAWVNQTEAIAEGVFAKVRDAGVRCIAAPCASLIERGLNTSRSAMIAGIDFTAARLTDAQREALGQDLVAPSGILVAGERYTVKENGRKAKGRTATAAFRRLVSPAAE